MTTGRQSLTQALAGAQKDISTMFRDTTERMSGVLVSVADAEGIIDPNRDEEMQRRLGDIVQGLFVGSDGRRAFMQDGVTPIAPYPSILNKWYVQIVYAQVKAQHDWMQRHIPEDVFAFLSSGRRSIQEQDNPFLRGDDESIEAYKRRLADLRIFRPNPLAELDPSRRWVPMHRWNDPNGYRLSDRIWQNSIRTRVKVDALVAEAIRDGMSAVQLAKRLEQFLLPERAALRTRRPYGSDGSFDAMRLARSEIARAANQAAFTAAYLNPYVDKIDVRRSPNGDPKCPICPQHATIGIGGERIREPYDINNAHLPIFHPHCKCLTLSVVTDSPGVVTERLRAVMQDAQVQLLEPVMTPAQVNLFTRQLLGQGLMNLLAQVLQLPLF